MRASGRSPTAYPRVSKCAMAMAARPGGGGELVLSGYYSARCLHMPCHASLSSAPLALLAMSARIDLQHFPDGLRRPRKHLTDKCRVGRARYTALNEQPGHEMKPLLSSRHPQSVVVMATYPWSGRITACIVHPTAMTKSLQQLCHGRRTADAAADIAIFRSSRVYIGTLACRSPLRAP